MQMIPLSMRDRKLIQICRYPLYFKENAIFQPRSKIRPNRTTNLQAFPNIVKDNHEQTQVQTSSVCSIGSGLPKHNFSTKKDRSLHQRLVQQCFDIKSLQQRYHLENSIRGTIFQRRAQNSQQQIRSFSMLPDVLQNFSIWGGSGYVLKTIHMNGVIPYWACVSITNIGVRTSLLPLVIDGAKTSIKFASVAPEVQFLMTMFQKEMVTLKEGGANPEQRKKHFWMNFSTLRQIYKIHGINPFAVFKVSLPLSSLC